MSDGTTWYPLLNEQILDRRQKNAESIASVRADRDRRKVCRTCEGPLAISKKSGKLGRHCSVHMAKDALRKSRSRGRRLSSSGGSYGPSPSDELVWEDDLIVELPWA